MRKLLIIFLLISTPAIAANVTWTGGAGTGDWWTGANWNTGSVPGSGDVPVYGNTDAGRVISITNSFTVSRFATQEGVLREFVLSPGVVATSSLGATIQNIKITGGTIQRALSASTSAQFEVSSTTWQLFDVNLSATTATTLGTGIFNNVTIETLFPDTTALTFLYATSGANSKHRYEFNSCTGTIDTTYTFYPTDNTKTGIDVYFKYDSPAMRWDVANAYIGNVIATNSIVNLDFRAGTLRAKTAWVQGVTDTNSLAQAILNMSGGTIYATNTFTMRTGAQINHSGGELYLAKTYGNPITNAWYSVPEGHIGVSVEEAGWYYVTVTGVPIPPETGERRLRVPSVYNEVNIPNVLWP